MTEREKIIKVIDEWANKAVQSNRFDGASVYNPHNAAELADTIIAAGFRDVDDRGKIFMNGEAIVPSPDIYNEVAKLLDCPQMLGFEPDVIEVKVRDDAEAEAMLKEMKEKKDD